MLQRQATRRVSVNYAHQWNDAIGLDWAEFLVAADFDGNEMSCVTVECLSLWLSGEHVPAHIFLKKKLAEQVKAEVETGESSDVRSSLFDKFQCGGG
jgi:hypothetical protein